MKTAARWIRRLLDMSLVVLVSAVLGLVLAVNVGPMLGYQLIALRGGSMEPALHSGSAIVVSQVQPSDLRPGDIVTRREANGTTISHRITRIVELPDGLYVETRGDANPAVDTPLLPVSSVSGRVDTSIPGLGYILFSLTLPTGVAAILCLALTILFAIALLEEAEEKDHDYDGYEYESELARTLDAQRTREFAS